MDELVVKILPVGQMETNCYLLIDKKTGDALIIDPGDCGDYITQVLGDEKAIPTQILATHGHFDHILAAAELKLNFKIPLLCHKNDLFLVKDMLKRAQYYLPDTVAINPKIDKYLGKGDLIKIGNHTLLVIETPGHTPGSICLYLKEKNILFTGDTIFAGGGVGRTDFSYCSSSDLKTSLENIFNLPGKTIIYPGHGDSSTLDKEKAIHSL